MICPCVGLASTPFSAIFTHTSHASFPFLGLIIMAFNNPFPRTNSIILESIARIASLNIFPSFSARSANFSSLTTSNAAIATLAASGFPPKVEPCSPGLITSIISSFAKTAETGRTPPERAFPKIKISGFTFS